ncbi:lipocalin family protein [Adhaeribacter terreus]|uniref:Lipocalin family protein n=1 Tax=Adhaeribacter terreus TaxID=529703 RepID=A0ABW0EDC0_9BACT
MKKYTLFLALGASLAFYSCEKKDPVKPITHTPNTPPETDTTPKIIYLQAKSWRLTGLTQGAPGSALQADLYKSGFPNCQKDDLYKFNSPDALVVAPGQNTCSSGETEKSGTWNLNNNSTFLTITNPSQTMIGMTGNFAVSEITATKMILKQTVNDSEYTLTFTAQ